MAQKFLQDARASGLFIFLDTDLKIDKPQTVVQIDRSKAALLGLKMSDVGSALTAMLGGGYVNYFGLDGRSYKVIPQVQQRYRLNPSQLLNYYVRTASGASVPLSTIAHASPRTPRRNRSTTSSSSTPRRSRAWRRRAWRWAPRSQYLQELAARELPQGYSVDYGGLSRQYVQESGGFVVTFGFALIIIYLSLAALFESFRDPLIILVSVPMSIAGALFFVGLGLGGASLNIYTEVGLVTLMGLISKHGILIVEFANNLQKEGHTRARGDRDGGRHPVAADPDDDRGDGAGRGAADCRHRRRRGVALQHGSGDRHRPVDRHAVHAVRGAGGVYADRRGPPCAGAGGG